VKLAATKSNVTVLAKPTEDSHFVDARPSFVVSLRNADALIDGGAELELGWLPPLFAKHAQPEDRDRQTGTRSGVSGNSPHNCPQT